MNDIPDTRYTRSGDLHMESARYLADHIPRARLVELPGADALPYTPGGGDDILDEIQEFLTGEVEGAARTLAASRCTSAPAWPHSPVRARS